MPLVAWLLLLTATAFWARRSGRSAATWTAGVGWLSFPGYNAWLRQSCAGDCGIRVDLLVVLPVLLSVTAAALWQWWRMKRHHGQTGSR